MNVATEKVAAFPVKTDLRRRVWRYFYVTSFSCRPAPPRSSHFAPRSRLHGDGCISLSLFRLPVARGCGEESSSKAHFSRGRDQLHGRVSFPTPPRSSKGACQTMPSLMRLDGNCSSIVVGAVCITSSLTLTWKKARCQVLGTLHDMCANLVGVNVCNVVELEPQLMKYLEHVCASVHIEWL